MPTRNAGRLLAKRMAKDREERKKHRQEHAHKGGDHQNQHEFLQLNTRKNIGIDDFFAAEEELL